MKQMIIGNWNFVRVLRLLLGIAIIVQAFTAKDTWLGIAGLLFTTMAVINVGCCGSGGCYSSYKKTSETKKDISYEEVV